MTQDEIDHALSLLIVTVEVLMKRALALLVADIVVVVKTRLLMFETVSRPTMYTAHTCVPGWFTTNDDLRKRCVELFAMVQSTNINTLRIVGLIGSRGPSVVAWYALELLSVVMFASLTRIDEFGGNAPRNARAPFDEMRP